MCHARGGETRESMLIWLPDHEICFTGNVFSALFGHFPNLVTIRGDRYRDPLEFVSSLDRVAALNPKQLLVGHHGPVDGRDLIAEELARLRAAVLHVHDRVVDGMNSGVDVATLMREIDLPDEFEVGQGYGKVAWLVRAIWENYVGWFHHQSTTELYGVPAVSVHADLVEMSGGAEAVAQRALLKANGDKPQQAIHLAEIAFAVEPGNATALRASIAAHEQLESQSVNFWETAWLRRQLATLRARLGDN